MKGMFQSLIALSILFSAVFILFSETASAFVAPEEIYIDRGVVDSIVHSDRSIRIGDRVYFFEKNKNLQQVTEDDISPSDHVEIYYKKVNGKNMITRIKRIQKE